jgi:hypothetical protein
MTTMNASRIAFVLGLATVALGCTASLTVKTQKKFNNSPDKTVQAPADWNNEAIVITDQGVGAAITSGDSQSGLQIVGDPNAKRVSATAHVIAYADDTDEASADQSIADVLPTFTIVTSGNTTTISCGHGGDHGSSKSGLSGCENMVVTVPAGSVTQPLTIQQANVGNGDLTVKGVTGSVAVKNDGAGNVDISVTPAKGSTIAAQGTFDVIARLPANFAADLVTLTGDTSTDSTDFADVKSGQARGNVGEGAKSITLTGDKVSLKKQ